MKTKMRNFRKILIEMICLALVFCVLLGVTPLYANEEGAEEEPKTVQIAVIVRDLPKGSRLTDSFIELKEVANIHIPENAVRSLDDITGKYAATDLYVGEYLQKDQMTSTKQTDSSNDVIIKPIIAAEEKFLVVTDYIKADTGKDITAALQLLIDKNPKRTIYFPDGEYLISSTLFLSAMPSESVTLRLSDGAVIRASKSWSIKSNCNFLIAIGGKRSTNDIYNHGSYYCITGGTFDGSGKADGILYDKGRESLIRNVCIKNVDIGIKIELGINNGSSDADFEDITIYGTGTTNSRGIWVIGHDNTFTNIRIYNMHTGVQSNGGSSLYKDIYVYLDPEVKETLEGTKGFTASLWAWISACYAENYEVAFHSSDERTIISDCVAVWTSDKSTTQIAVSAHPAMTIGGVRAEFYDGEGIQNIFFSLSTNSRHEKKKIINGCFFNESVEDSNKFYEDYCATPIIPIS